MTESLSTHNSVQVSPIGVVGTGVMGASLARNLARNLNKPIAVFDLDQAKVDALVARHPEANLLAFSDLGAFVAVLEHPQVVLLMVPAGKPVDASLTSLCELLEPGGIVIDGGNTHFWAEIGVKLHGARGGELAGILHPGSFSMLGVGVSMALAVRNTQPDARVVLVSGDGAFMCGGMSLELAFQEKNTGNTAIYIFALSVIFVFLALAAQYESWVLPFAIILIVPLAILAEGGRLGADSLDLLDGIGARRLADVRSLPRSGLA